MDTEEPCLSGKEQVHWGDRARGFILWIQKAPSPRLQGFAMLSWIFEYQNKEIYKMIVNKFTHARCQSQREWLKIILQSVLTQIPFHSFLNIILKHPLSLEMSQSAGKTKQHLKTTLGSYLHERS